MQQEWESRSGTCHSEKYFFQKKWAAKIGCARPLASHSTGASGDSCSLPILTPRPFPPRQPEHYSPKKNQC